MRKKIFLIVGVLASVLLGPASGARASEVGVACDGSLVDPERMRARDAPAPDRPSLERLPVPISVGLQIKELSAIDERTSSFRFEGYGIFKYCDPRLAFDPVAEGKQTRRYVGMNIDDPIWNVKLHVANGIGSAEVTQRLIVIDADGSIRLFGYFNSLVGTAFDLRLFPFDRQALTIQMESFNYPAGVVELVSSDDHVSLSNEIISTDWRIEGIRSRVENVLNPRGAEPFSRAVVTIDVSREWAFYLFKLWIPLTLIVALSWSVFWMHDESLAGRMRISATSFLTVVAYQFSIVGSLPKVSYLTLMDRLMIGSFILIALTGLQSMRAVALRASSPQHADRLDRVCRWLFPASYVGWIVAMWLFYAP